MRANRYDRCRLGGWSVIVVLPVLFLVMQTTGCRKTKSGASSGWRHPAGKTVALPLPNTQTGMPLAKAIAVRRSQREFARPPLTTAHLSQLCWAAQGVTSESGHRAAPSAGGLYPVTLIIADQSGVYEYRPETHDLVSRGEKDVRGLLQKAGLNQTSIGEAPVCFIVTIDVNITAKKYGKESERYCLMESGHVTQNLLLTATSLKLVAVPIGAMYEDRVSRALGLPGRLRPVSLIPVGHPR